MWGEGLAYDGAPVTNKVALLAFLKVKNSQLEHKGIPTPLHSLIMGPSTRLSSPHCPATCTCTTLSSLLSLLSTLPFLLLVPSTALYYCCACPPVSPLHCPALIQCPITSCVALFVCASLLSAIPCHLRDSPICAFSQSLLSTTTHSSLFYFLRPLGVSWCRL